MKNFILVIGVVALAAGTVSCKKTYQCECTWNSGSLAGQTTTLETAEKVSKSDATAWCDENAAALSYADGTCVLK